MGRSSNLDKFLALKDTNGVSVGSWARPNSPGVALCKVCDCPVDFRQGGRDLTKHSQTSKHIARSGKDPPGVSQLTLQERKKMTKKS